MLDSSPISTAMQRSKGCARVTIGLGGVIDLAQSGSAKAMLPKKTVGLPEVVFLNTSGGLASGDMLEFGLELRPGTHALATTQTAERAYRAEESPARAHVTLQIGENGWLDWLPQETILFNGSQLDRATEVNLARGAGCLLLEMIVLGRLAMGEEVSHLHLTDRRVVRQAGRVIHHDALAVDAQELTRLENPAMLQGARAMATLVMISSDAPDRLRTARDVLNEAGVTSAASAPPGRLVIRMLATDGWPLRRQVNRLLLTLRPDPLPRIWQI